MKRITIVCLAILFFHIYSAFAIDKTLVAEVCKSSQLVRLELINYNIVYGNVVEMTNDSLKIQKQDGTVEQYPFSRIVDIEASKHGKSSSLSIGVGNSYGGLGINYEYYITDVISAFFGMGCYSSDAEAEGGYQIGAVATILRNNWVSPRLIMSYGSYCFDDYYYENYETFPYTEKKYQSNFSFGIGCQFMFLTSPKLGVVLDLMITPDEFLGNVVYDDYGKRINRITPCLGLKIEF